MTDHKLTDNEIIKALNCCAEAEYCATCRARDFCKGMDGLMENSLALINRQKAEIERLQKLGAAATRRLVEVKAEANKEIERMKEEVNKYPCRVRMNENSIVRSKSLEDYDRLIGDISAEAIKEFAQRLKVKVGSIPQYHFNLLQVEDDINTLVKEMTEELK